MGWRFRRRVSLFPGLRVNFSRSGASVSIGHRGAWLTIGPKGRRATVGLPGTGVYWTETAKTPPLVALTPSRSALSIWAWLIFVGALVVALAWLWGR